MTRRGATVKQFFIVLYGAVLLLMQGCAGNPISATATEADLRTKAAVVLSVSHDLGAVDGAKAIFYLDEARFPGRVVMESIKTIASFPQANEFPDRRGHVYVLELEPGQHTIDGWQVASAGARIHPSVRAPALTFEVQAGQVLYLGNLHAQLTLGHKMLFGSRAAYDARVVVQDKSSQDVEIAESRTPALKGKVQKALLPLGPWSATKETERRIDPVPVPFVPKK